MRKKLGKLYNKDMEMTLPSENLNPAGTIKRTAGDMSSWSLLTANIVTIILAVLENWSLSSVLFAYWIQSVIIGFFSFLKILDKRRFTTAGIRSNGVPVTATPQAKISLAFFFLFHYGFFHLGYFLFLASRHYYPSFNNMLQCFVIFFMNHLFSFLLNRENDRQKMANLGTMMFAPYLRIFPMHLIIIFGSQLPYRIALTVFLFIKTLVDLAGHSTEHALKVVTPKDPRFVYDPDAENIPIPPPPQPPIPDTGGQSNGNTVPKSPVTL